MKRDLLSPWQSLSSKNIFTFYHFHSILWLIYYFSMFKYFERRQCSSFSTHTCWSFPINAFFIRTTKQTCEISGAIFSFELELQQVIIGRVYICAIFKIIQFARLLILTLTFTWNSPHCLVDWNYYAVKHDSPNDSLLGCSSYTFA